jgi:hypothetical protein
MGKISKVQRDRLIVLPINLGVVNMLRPIILIALALMITGCATSGRIGTLPSVAENESSSQIVLIRVSSFVGGANSYYVALDGKDVFSIRSGEYTKFTIPTGEHFISVKCFGGWTPTWKEEAKKFNALADQGNYFEISPNLNCAEIVSIDSARAMKEMKSSDFVNPDALSNKQ